MKWLHINVFKACMLIWISFYPSNVTRVHRPPTHISLSLWIFRRMKFQNKLQLLPENVHSSFACTLMKWQKWYRWFKSTENTFICHVSHLEGAGESSDDIIILVSLFIWQRLLFGCSAAKEMASQIVLVANWHREKAGWFHNDTALERPCFLWNKLTGLLLLLQVNKIY